MTSLSFTSGREKGRCVASEYFLEPEVNLVTENTENILSKCSTLYTTLGGKVFGEWGAASNVFK